MSSLRRLLRANRTVACLLVAAAMLVKVLVPAGYMVAGSESAVLLSVCDATGAHSVKQVVIPVKSQPSDANEAAKKQCPFSSIGTQGLAATDQVLLASAILYILALGFASAPRLHIAGIDRLRPPLRGPPSPA